MSRPLLVVGVDGLPPALLQRLISEDAAPNLKRLVSRGCFGTLRSTPNYQSASAWTSLVTGVNPGKHGILHFTNPVRGSYQFAQIDARARLMPTLWRMLSDGGATVAALNVPVSFPVEPIRGVMIGGWLCPSASTPGFTHPPELARRLVEEFGGYPIHPDVRRHATSGRYDLAAEAARTGIRTKLHAAAQILARERPEVLCVVVTETDSIQHWCWHLLDETHPLHDPAEAERWRAELRAVYSALDAGLGRLLDAAGEDADVLVVSDHGQAPNSGGQVLLRPWLVHEGHLVPGGRRGAERAADGLLRAGLGALRRRAGNQVKAWLRARLPGMQSRAQAAASGFVADWPRTRVSTETGHLFVNLRGRWPEGCVAPGAEYEALLGDLTEALLALRDEATGLPAVREVTRGAGEFGGPEADLMPDLLVHWRNDLLVRRLIARDGSVIARRNPPELPLGAHHPDGTVVASGPSFLADDRPVAASIYDVAPTVLHLLGQPVPTYMDGRVLAEMIRPERAEEVRRVVVNAPAGQGGRSMAAREDEVVRGRLRSLGYIE